MSDAATPTIGLIANPVSARDIRRVVANAGNLQTSDRVNIVLRVLSAAAACGVQRVLTMPDRAGLRALLQRALQRERAREAWPRVEFLDMEPTSSVADTFIATQRLVQAGVAAIVVLGGDGTHRAVVRELRRLAAPIPIAGLSTGTNNAFPEMREPTVTGIAVGLYASGRVSAASVLAAEKLLEVVVESPHETRHEIAIVDAVISAERCVGARALWKPDSLRAAYLAFADPQCIGLSALGGLLHPVGRRQRGGLAIDIAPDPHAAAVTLHAPIAPGMVRPVPIAGWRPLAADAPVAVTQREGTVALDGERELAFERGSRLCITLRENAFFTLDVTRCMLLAARHGLLHTR
ncbi:MAG TPA: NAD(+)/NADH kinase [Burkholderiaceae bacterium]|jgi:predicted polyphosphate/ATP-dependent NAD kinase|nr:NAD(+)/NADH kinase [Burkholderiaceae bacterium]